ncbi:AraC family transcriptional regulator [Marivirga arenosa]|uniref:AraC family transcriptional regulator n=1 Tax=Marivirga arenosa TaxID=3059076 RepID=A0AA49JA44_9BACT|nr:AraC family transcriptional regulator [Marivirga sp. BKB1-2]WKK80034.1 AraC family transcriptional regulator [Marivirga sp. BKB1-2]
MNDLIKPYQIPLKTENSLFTLVENRTAYTYDSCELNVFETHQKAEDVKLVFNDFVFTSMLRGKKIMHLENKESFEYLPGESVIVGPNEIMEIDFPEAKEDQPTQCIALAISQHLIDFTLEMLNEKHPKVLDQEKWEIDPSVHHIINNQELINTVNRIIKISKSENSVTKDLYIDLAMKEMIIRLMQTQARHVFTSSIQTLSNHHPLAYAIEIIQSKITEKIDFDKLANAACMSRASFFKKFKETFGYTPGQYVLSERIKLAKQWLKKSNCSITEACFNSGFENLSHFTSTFKKETGLSPSSFQKQFRLHAN